MVKVILFYADWCPACRSFKPEWAKLKDMVRRNNLPNVYFAEYNADKDAKIFEESQVRSMPTIHVQFNGKAYEYTGGRNAESIYDKVSKIVSAEKMSKSASNRK